MRRQQQLWAAGSDGGAGEIGFGYISAVWAHSYICLVTPFYVDNGKNLPLWKELPPIAFWLLPAAIGIPLTLRALFWHRLPRHRGLP